MGVEYNIKRGMKTRELYNELHGRTAGENQRERALLFSEWQRSPDVHLDDFTPKGIQDHLGLAGYHELASQMSEETETEKFVGRMLPKAQVITEFPGNYALVLEYSIADKDILPGDLDARTLPQDLNMERRLAEIKALEEREVKATPEEVEEIQREKTAVASQPIVKKGHLVKRFYLVGLNDEGLYFVRPLQGITNDRLRNIDSLLTWLNKVDLGYTERVQGDIVVRFMPKNSKNYQFRNSFAKFMRLAHVSYRLPKNGNNKGYTDWYRLDSMRLTKSQNFGDHRIRINGGGHIVFPHMSGDYAIEPLVVDARSFSMTHAEHGMRTIEVPKDHYAVLASQRGRDEITGHGIFD